MTVAAIVCDPVALASRNLGAHTLGPDGRKQIALRVLSGGQTTEVARAHKVSRKFVYGQVAVAKAAIDDAFVQAPDDNERVLFHVAVTKSLVRMIVLALLLRCHSSYRGVRDFFADVFGHQISIGTIHSIAVDAMAKAKGVTATVNLDPVTDGCHDEIYQAGAPVLVGVDAHSTYCYLLAAVDNVDGETWGCHLLDVMARGLSLECVVADLGSGLRRGHGLVMPDVPCYADLFHMFRDIGDVARYYGKKLEAAVTRRKELDDKMAALERKGKKQTRYSSDLGRARETVRSLGVLVDTIETLFAWLRDDVLTLAGPRFDDRAEMFDYVTCEMKRLEPPYGKLAALRKSLESHKDALLGFAKAIDAKLDELSSGVGVDKYLLERMTIMLGKNDTDSTRYVDEIRLRCALGWRFHDVRTAVASLLARTTRASSLVENTNSLLRNYFFLRRQIGPGYLDLLQFYLNHRVLRDSARPERKGKTPREAMTGQAHAHWLELLGYKPLRNAG